MALLQSGRKKKYLRVFVMMTSSTLIARIPPDITTQLSRALQRQKTPFLRSTVVKDCTVHLMTGRCSAFNAAHFLAIIIAPMRNLDSDRGVNIFLGRSSSKTLVQALNLRRFLSAYFFHKSSCKRGKRCYVPPDTLFCNEETFFHQSQP